MKCLLPLLLLAVQVVSAQTDTITDHVFRRELRLTVGARYLLYLPGGYGRDSAARWPLVLFLHGSGERGSDPASVAWSGPPHLAAEGKKFPFVLVAPQCPAGEIWSVETLGALLDEMEERYLIDRSRICVTGLSLGGTGTWNLALAFPERFAAIAPVCGRTDPTMVERVCRLKKLPVWVFHGAKDDIVPPSDSEAMVRALERCGGNVTFTLYPDANHNSWDAAYSDPRLYEWLLAQRRN